jgi:anti-sigma regulatory factor (Ser/Thr protein kinase)
MIIPSDVDASPQAMWPMSSSLPPLGALLSAPGSARAYARDVLACWQLSALSDLCETIVSELVTNALQASTAPTGGLIYINGHMPLIRVCLMSDKSQVVIECHDEALGQPEPKDVDPWTAESGRGLALVHELTGGRWGWSLKKRQHGKVVWAVLTAGA